MLINGLGYANLDKQYDETVDRIIDLKHMQYLELHKAKEIADSAAIIQAAIIQAAIIQAAKMAAKKAREKAEFAEYSKAKQTYMGLKDKFEPHHKGDV